MNLSSNHRSHWRRVTARLLLAAAAGAAALGAMLPASQAQDALGIGPRA